MENNFNNIDTSSFNVDLTAPILDTPQQNIPIGTQPLDINKMSSLSPDLTNFVNQIRQSTLSSLNKN